MQAVQEGPRWMLRLATGEELLETLGRFAKERTIRAAAIPMGIGQLKSAQVGFWTGRHYDAKEIDTPVELISLSGSIAEADGQPSVHLHASLGLADHSTVSGHLLQGSVGLLAEILVESFPNRTFTRSMDPAAGLRTLDLSSR